LTRNHWLGNPNCSDASQQTPEAENAKEAQKN